MLTLGAKTPNHAKADVLIEEGRVAEVGPGLRARGAQVVDAGDSIVMPGFVDTHRHVWKALLRNLGHGGPSGEPVVPAEVYGSHYQPDDVYAATLIGLLGAIEAGITTVVDWSDIQVDDRYTDAAMQAHADAGVRTVFVHARPPWAGGGGDRGALRRFVAERPRTSVPSTTIAVGPPDPVRGDLDGVASEWSVARDHGLRIHAHAGTAVSDTGLVSALAGSGLLAGDVTLVHCTHLVTSDFEAIASSGASVSLTPSVEMAAGHGAPPLQILIDHGIRPGLGVDDERVTPGDMFSQMRATNSIQHATMFDLKLAGKAGLPTLLTTREVIRFATIDGAKAAGVGDATGSIEVGKEADIIVLRADRPNIAPVNDPIGAVVWGMDTSNLDWVFVGGEAVMAEGSVTAGVDRARKLATEAQQRVAGAAGLLSGAGGAA